MNSKIVKSEGALRTIGEVAASVGVATHVLRFWENKFPEIKPQKRRGRRYYSVEDVKIIEEVKLLLYTKGYTIKGVKQFLNNKNKDNHNTMVEDSNELTSIMERIFAIRNNINKLKQDLDQVA